MQNQFYMVKYHNITTESLELLEGDLGKIIQEIAMGNDFLIGT
jgi:hypothetical protein